MMKKNWLVVGVGGSTCSGKTSLVNRLKEQFRGAVVFHQDDYFHPQNDPRHVRIAELNHNNWEIVTAVDMDALYRNVSETLRKSVDEGKRKNVLILDGFLIFNHKPLLDLCDLRYFIHLTKEVCFERRRTRTYDPPDVPGYFNNVVWPEYKKHYSEIMGNPELRNSVTFFDGTLPQNEIFQKVFDEIKESL